MIISNNENRVFDAYAHNIFYFLRCRHLEEDLQAAIKKYLYYIHLQKPSYLSVTKTKSVIIPYEEILYADMYKNTLRIHLTDNTILEERKTLNAFYSAVPSNYFAFLSRSTIVNMIHIRSVATDSITMKNTLTLPIGTTRKETFFSSYRKYIYRKILE